MDLNNFFKRLKHLNLIYINYKMSEYKNAKIYKIVDKTNNNLYIGSTIQSLKNRLSNHEYDYKKYLIGKRYYISSFKILENNNYSIELIEAYPCESKAELEKREGFYIKSIECVNKHMAGQNKIDTEEYNKQYYDINKKIILERMKQKIYCMCGSETTHCHKARHERSQKHIKFVQAQQLQSI
jgi:hypothetical protein